MIVKFITIVNYLSCSIVFTGLTIMVGYQTFPNMISRQLLTWSEKVSAYTTLSQCCIVLVVLLTISCGAQRWP